MFVNACCFLRDAANDGKIYESSLLPNSWIEKKANNAERPIWMLTVEDPKANAKLSGRDGASRPVHPMRRLRADQQLLCAAGAQSSSHVDPASGLVFPDMFYLLGERAAVGKKDAMNLAKAFKGTGHDTAEWPSGLIATKCGRCDNKVDDGVLMVCVEACRAQPRSP